MVKCDFCAAENEPGATRCSVCLRPLKVGTLGAQEKFRRISEFYPRGESMIPKRRTRSPLYAGALLIIAAIFYFGGILITNLYISEFYPEYSGVFARASILSIAIGGLIALGGILAMVRRGWALCAAAAGIGVVLFGIGGAYLNVAFCFGALVFILISKDEFDK